MKTSRGKSDKGTESKKYGELAIIQLSSSGDDDDYPIECFLIQPLLSHSDDPYYCGLRARVPNFAKMNGNAISSSSEKKGGFFSKIDRKPKEIVEKEKEPKSRDSVTPKHRQSTVQMPHPASFSTLYQLHQTQNGLVGTISKKGTFQRHNSQPEYSMWHAKSFESGIGELTLDVLQPQ